MKLRYQLLSLAFCLSQGCALETEAPTEEEEEERELRELEEGYCGDAQVDADENCDDGSKNGTAPGACRADCSGRNPVTVKEDEGSIGDGLPVDDQLTLNGEELYHDLNGNRCLSWIGGETPSAAVGDCGQGAASQWLYSANEKRLRSSKDPGYCLASAGERGVQMQICDGNELWTRPSTYLLRSQATGLCLVDFGEGQLELSGCSANQSHFWWRTQSELAR